MIPLIIKGCLLPHLVNTKEPPAERGLHEGNRWAKRGAQCCRIDWRWHRHRVAMATPRPPPPSRQQEIAHERYFRKAIKRRKKKFCFLLSSYFRRTYKRCFQEPCGWRFASTRWKISLACAVKTWDERRVLILLLECLLQTLWRFH